MSAEVFVAPAVATSAPADPEAVAADNVAAATAAPDATAATKVTDESSTSADVVADTSVPAEPIAPITATPTAADGDPPTNVDVATAAAPKSAASTVADQTDSAPIVAEQLLKAAPVQTENEPPAPKKDTTIEPITSTSSADAIAAQPEAPAAERASAVQPAVGGGAVDGSRAATASVTSDSEDLLESESGVVTTASVSVQSGCVHVCIGIAYFQCSSYADMFTENVKRERGHAILYTRKRMYTFERMYVCVCALVWMRDDGLLSFAHEHELEREHVNCNLIIP